MHSAYHSGPVRPHSEGIGTSIRYIAYYEVAPTGAACSSRREPIHTSKWIAPHVAVCRRVPRGVCGRIIYAWRASPRIRACMSNRVSDVSSSRAGNVAVGAAHDIGVKLVVPDKNISCLANEPMCNVFAITAYRLRTHGSNGFVCHGASIPPAHCVERHDHLTPPTTTMSAHDHGNS